MSLATIVTRDPGRRAARELGPSGRRPADDVEALWERAAEHDLVVVATPNRFHVPLGLAALEAGLPVVIDKPMAPTAEEGRRLMIDAAERDLFLTVFQNRRWDGDFLTVRRLISEDAFGPIVRFESRFERWRPQVREGAWRERGDPEEAGGLLFDLGSHLIDQAVVLFGPPLTVYAEVDRRRPCAEVDDDMFVALEHEEGVRSHLWMSVLAAIRGPRMRVLGLRAAFEKFGLDVQEQALSEGARPDDAAWGREPPDRWGRVSTGEDERTIETRARGLPRVLRGCGGVAAGGRTAARGSGRIGRGAGDHRGRAGERPDQARDRRRIDGRPLNGAPRRDRCSGPPRGSPRAAPRPIVEPHTSQMPYVPSSSLSSARSTSRSFASSFFAASTCAMRSTAWDVPSPTRLPNDTAPIGSRGAAVSVASSSWSSLGTRSSALPDPCGLHGGQTPSMSGSPPGCSTWPLPSVEAKIVGAASERRDSSSL